MDLHNYKQRFDRTLERLEKSDISKGNKALIHEFKDYCLCQGISYGKLDAYLFYLVKFVNMLQKPIEKAHKGDIIRVIAELNQTKYSEETKVCFKIAVRRLYKIVRNTEGKGKYPEEVEWISTSISKNHKKLPEELLTDEEIEGLIRAGQNSRDKALLSILAESGARVSEIGTMKIKHISFEEYGTRITISGKTGSRKILVINSTPYLQEWLNLHPENNNPDSYLWYNQQNAPCLCYARISAILKLAAKRAGIIKRVYPHLLRHTRATRMACIMSEAAMKQYFGWTQSSKMAGVYVHMSGRDTDEAVLRANGIEVEKKVQVSKLKPKTCLRCKTVNQTTNRFCKTCGFALDSDASKLVKEEEEIKDINGMMEELIKDPDVVKLLCKKMREKSLITENIK